MSEERTPACNAFTGDPELDKKLHEGEVIEGPRAYRINLHIIIRAESIFEATGQAKALGETVGAESFTIDSLIG